MRKLIFILVLNLFYVITIGQTVNSMQREYEYDAAGNRIVRKVVVIPAYSKSHKSNSQSDTTSVEQDDIYSDNAGDIRLLVYPNPTTSDIHIQIEDEIEIINGNILIYNTNGSEIGQQSFSGLRTKVDLSNFVAGIYFVRVNINGRTTTWKVVKQ